jgi:hypothetical protein
MDALPEGDEELISLTQAAREVGVSRNTMDYYTRVLELKTTKLLLDNNLYLTKEDVERIKGMREAAARRKKR